VADLRRKEALYTGTIHRVLAAAAGVFFAGIGVYGIFFAETPAMWRIPGGIAFLLIGGNAIYSSYKSKVSWISKIGPLP
jgi:hypothetical protein